MNAVAKIAPHQHELSVDVQRMEKQFAMALPEHVTPERFVRVVVTAIQSNPDLQRADRESVLSAALKCAQDGLLPDGREAALVVYGGRAQYLPMIAGVLAKVRRSGELLTISAHVVHEKDAFAYVLGDEEKIEHQPFLDGPRGKPIAVYAIAKTKDGGVYRDVMSVEDVEKVRSVSKARNNGPWVQWWGEMARKTVLRRLAKRLPMSTDLLQVFQRDDDHYDFGARPSAPTHLRRLHDGFDELPENVSDDHAVPRDGDDNLPAASPPTASESGEAQGQAQPSPPHDFPGDRPVTQGGGGANNVPADGTCQFETSAEFASVLPAYIEAVETVAALGELWTGFQADLRRLQKDDPVTFAKAVAAKNQRKATLEGGVR